MPDVVVIRRLRIAIAAMELGVTESCVRSLLAKGKLKYAPKEEWADLRTPLITGESIEAYKATRRGRKSQTTSPIQQLPEQISYRGKEMIPEWPAKIAAAQAMTHYDIDGKLYVRLPFTDSGHCDDCGVIAGELHVPTCDAEICPKCGAPAAGCPCKAMRK